MKRAVAALTAISLAALLAAGQLSTKAFAAEQSETTAQKSQATREPAPVPQSGQEAGRQPGMMGQGGMMMGGGMQGRMMQRRMEYPMMHPKMGCPPAPMGGPGMMGGYGMMMMNADAKTRGKMMQIQGQMMKQMGELMEERGKAIEQGK